MIFNRDILINETEAIENCVNSRDILSEETITEQHPWTKNVQKEMERKKAEREEQKAAADSYRTSFINGRVDQAKGVTNNVAE